MSQARVPAGGVCRPRSRRLRALLAILGVLSAFAAVRVVDACTSRCDYSRSPSVLLSDRSFFPADVTAAFGQGVLFHNIDGVSHTVTKEDPECRATAWGTPCPGSRFDLTLVPGRAANKAVVIGAFQDWFLPSGTYLFYCKFHSPAPGVGMVGSFTIVDNEVFLGVDTGIARHPPTDFYPIPVLGGSRVPDYVPPPPPRPGWVERMPVARMGAAASFDSIRGRTVMFGGLGPVASSAPLAFGDTWEWNGSTWTAAAPAGSRPAARMHATMAFDAARGHTVLFGGLGPGEKRPETWLWDGSTWMLAVTPVAPPPRFGHAMTYDAGRGRVVLFGGSSVGTRKPLGDAWAWDGTTWSPLSENPTGAPEPQARAYPGMTYDARREVVVLFGGYGDEALNDVWELDGATWTQRAPAASPPARYGAVLAFDSARGEALLAGGTSGTGTNLADVWAWNGTSWSARPSPAPPAARRFAAGAFDGARNKLVLAGGFSNAHLSDTWEWDGAAWTLVAATPGARWGAAMAFDTDRGASVLFGGREDGGGASGTWEWNGAVWRRAAATASPPLRSHAAMAYDSGRGRMVLFGGTQEPCASVCPGLGDIWEYDGTSWTQRSSGASPPPMAEPSMAYDPVRARTVLTGDGRTWEWDGAAWSDRGAGPLGAMTFDAGRGAIVMVTSRSDISGSGRLKVYDGTQWSSWGCDPLHLQCARAGDLFQPGIAYDAARDITVILGSAKKANGQEMTLEMYEWSAATLTLITGIVLPQPRWAPSMTFDTSRGATVLVGGQRNYREDQEGSTYAFGFSHAHGDLWHFTG